MHRRARVADAELNDDANADCDLVGGQNLLPLDRQIALAHVDQRDLHFRSSIEAEVDFTRDQVTAGFQNPRHHAVLVTQSAVCVLDDYFSFHNSSKTPRARIAFSAPGFASKLIDRSRTRSQSIRARRRFSYDSKLAAP